MELESYLQYFQYNSVVILSYFFICWIVLILNFFTNGFTNRCLFSSSRGSLLNPMTYVRLITHVFGHQNWKHFSGNFVYILLVGPMLEEKYGSKNLLIMMLLTAVIIGLFNFIIGRKRILGASGEVFMLIMLSSFTNVTTIYKLPLTMILLFIFYIVQEIIDGLIKKDDVSHMAHILGAVCGCVWGYLYMQGIFFTF